VENSIIFIKRFHEDDDLNLTFQFLMLMDTAQRRAGRMERIKDMLSGDDLARFEERYNIIDKKLVSAMLNKNQDF